MSALLQFLIAAMIACGAIMIGAMLAPRAIRRTIKGSEKEPERLPAIVPFELPIGNIEQPPAMHDPSREDY